MGIFDKIFKSTTSHDSASLNTKAGKPYFRYKAEWVWEDAALEYLQLTNKQSFDELTEDEEDKIYRYASMPVAYLAMWLVENDFINHAVHDDEDLADIRNRRETPVDFISRMDYDFSTQEMEEEILPFIVEYYSNSYDTYNTNDKANSHKEESDYYQCIKDGTGFYYCVDFSWENYDKIAAKINDAFKQYQEGIA